MNWVLFSAERPEADLVEGDCPWLLFTKVGSM